MRFESKVKTFLGMCLRGEAHPEDIDLHVMEYFNKGSYDFGCLRDFLGLTENDYYSWAYKGKHFKDLVEDYRKTIG